MLCRFKVWNNKLKTSENIDKTFGKRNPIKPQPDRDLRPIKLMKT